MGAYALRASHNGRSYALDVSGVPTSPDWDELRDGVDGRKSWTKEGILGSDDTPQPLWIRAIWRNYIGFPTTYLWTELFRCWVGFDTSSVTGTATSGSIKLQEMNNGTLEQDLGQTIAIYCWTPDPSMWTGAATLDAQYWLDMLADSSELASDDTFAVADITADDLLTFNLNAAGLSHINNGGLTAFSLMFTMDFTDNPPNPGATTPGDAVQFFGSQVSLGTDRPLLTLATTDPYIVSTTPQIMVI
jgi:hypothetical protein